MVIFVANGSTEPAKYWISEVCWPSELVSVAVGVPPVGGVVSTRSAPTYTVVTRDRSAPTVMSLLIVVRPRPSKVVSVRERNQANAEGHERMVDGDTDVVQ